MQRTIGYDHLGIMGIPITVWLVYCTLVIPASCRAEQQQSHERKFQISKRFKAPIHCCRAANCRRKFARNLFGLTEDLCLCRDLVLQCYHWKPPKEPPGECVFSFRRRVAASGASSTVCRRQYCTNFLKCHHGRNFLCGRSFLFLFFLTYFIFLSPDMARQPSWGWGVMTRPVVMVRGSRWCRARWNFFFQLFIIPRILPCARGARTNFEPFQKKSTTASLSLALWDRVGYWVPCLKERQTRRLSRCSLRPSRFQNELIMEVQNGAGSRRNTSTTTHPFMVKAGLEGRGGASSPSPIIPPPPPTHTHTHTRLTLLCPCSQLLGLRYRPMTCTPQEQRAGPGLVCLSRLRFNLLASFTGSDI